MTPERYERLHKILDAASREAPDARAAVLDRLCAGDPDLLQEARSLLAHHDAAEHIFPTTIPDLPTTVELGGGERGPDLVGRRVGPYRLLGMLGEGGFGVVYLAEQLEPVRRRVALKVIKPGMDSRAVVARFEQERQALAVMNHPSIARVFDAGTHEGRLSYFVMEYVPGEPITVYCDRQALPLRDRLELFLDVCEAVQHAHTKGIIHRDVKPSNILVTPGDAGAKPIVKVIDFGVAKALTQPLTDRTIHTQAGQIIGTIEYMSTEQAEMGAADIDTRSDVYSLGVVLYELLTSALPFDVRASGAARFEEIRRAIREVDPPKPSTRFSSLGEATALAAQRRRTRPADLAGELRRELDWIPLKALRKDRRERYRTPLELADDIRNYLAGRPLIAGPDSAAYRARKFIRRHRAGLAAGGAIALLGVAGLALLTRSVVVEARLRREAQARADEAERQSRRALESGRFTFRLLAGLAPVRDMHDVEAARAVLKSLVLDPAAEEARRAFPDHPDLRAAAEESIGTTYFSLAFFEPAREHLQSCIDLRRSALGEAHPDTLSATASLAEVLRELGRIDEAQRLAESGLAVAQHRPPGDEIIARLTRSLAGIRRVQGAYSDAERLIHEALSLLTSSLGPDHPARAEVMDDLATVQGALGRLSEAERTARSALKLRRRVLGSNHRDTLRSMNTLATIIASHAEDHPPRFDEAEPLLREALEGQRRVLGEAHTHTLTTMSDLALLLATRDAGAPTSAPLEDAESLLQQASDLSRRHYGVETLDTLMRLYNLADVVRQRGRHADAVPRFEEIVHVGSRSLAPGHWLVWYARCALGECLTALNRFEDAERHLLAARADCRRDGGDVCDYAAAVEERLVLLYEAWGKPDRAESHRRAARVSTP